MRALSRASRRAGPRTGRLEAVYSLLAHDSHRGASGHVPGVRPAELATGMQPILGPALTKLLLNAVNAALPAGFNGEIRITLYCHDGKAVKVKHGHEEVLRV